MKRIYWDRKLWAIRMTSKMGRPEGMLIGEAWHKVLPQQYLGAPTHCLLFGTRETAKAWCVEKEKECKRHSPDWKFRPVRVRERIMEIRSAMSKEKSHE